MEVCAGSRGRTPSRGPAGLSCRRRHVFGSAQFGRRDDANRASTLGRGFLEPNPDPLPFVLKFLELMLLHEGEQPLDLHKINAADFGASAGFQFRFFRHLEFEKISRGGSEIGISGCRHNDVILDAYAPDTFQVNAGLNREHHAFAK